MIWIIPAVYFLIGFAIAVALADTDSTDDLGWPAFVFFFWLPMAAVGMFCWALGGVIMAPAYLARFVRTHLNKLSS